MDEWAKILLNIFILYGWFVIGRMLIHVIISGALKLKNLIVTEKSFNKKMKIVERMKKDGEYHDWIPVMVGLKQYHVCQKTGWCPTIEGFISMEYVETCKKLRKEEEDYKEYRDNKVKDLAAKHSISLEDMEKLMESVFDIKKQWALLKIERLQEEAKDAQKKDGK